MNLTINFDKPDQQLYKIRYSIMGEKYYDDLMDIFWKVKDLQTIKGTKYEDKFEELSNYIMNKIDTLD